jgi:hypothetical protein
MTVTIVESGDAKKSALKILTVRPTMHILVLSSIGVYSTIVIKTNQNMAMGMNTIS